MREYKNFSPEAARTLKDGGVGVIPTDTLYGIVASAFSQKAVERVYALRRRARSKPVLVLIPSRAALKKFGIAPNASQRKFLRSYWPGKVSVILPLPAAGRKKFSHLHRGAGSLALRLPASAKLRAFLRKTGPLVAPSANLEGKPPAATVAETRKYFGSSVDFYVDAGRKVSKPSTLIRVGKVITIIRQGSVNIDK